MRIYKAFRVVYCFIFILLMSVPQYSSASTCDIKPPSATSPSPGGDHPDDTYAVDSGFFREGTAPFTSDPSVVTFQSGYARELTSFIDAYRKVEVKTDATSTALQLLNSTPLLVIPSGGLYGYENSAFFKATLAEFVSKGGTLIVFAQQHGYDFSIIPSPPDPVTGEPKPLSAFGWSEDQSCFWNGTYVDTYHQVLSGITTPVVSGGVDGYFSSYPDNATILLRRSINSQPAMLMYEYGAGRVIASSFYTDWAFAHSQATQDELRIVRDLITWAKKPAQLPEIRPGHEITVPVTVQNSTTTDAASVRFLVYNPDRTSYVQVPSENLTIPAGQTAATSIFYIASDDSPLGIYHIDYILLDAQGEMIQPQAETDSGRFVVSNPPSNLQKSPDFNFAVNSDSERYAYGSDAAFTVTMYNNTDTERTITAKYFFPHHYWETSEAQSGGDWNHRNLNHSRTLTISPRSSASFTHILQNARARIDRLWAYFYDESGKEVGMSSRGFYVFRPAVDVTLQTGKPLYGKGETVTCTLSLKNRQSVASDSELKVWAVDPANQPVYSTTIKVNLAAGVTSGQTISFPLPANAQGGFYTVVAEVLDSTATKIGGDSATFEIPLSQIAITPQLPTAYAAGANALSFRLHNSGKIPVTSGTLDVILKNPSGAVFANNSQPFTLDLDQEKTVSAQLTIPDLAFGSYTLAYYQGDETKVGKPATVLLPNTVAIDLLFDKPSYRVRDTAKLSINLANTGKFSLSAITVTVSVPDAGFSSSETVALAVGQNLPLTRSVLLPETLAAGLHTATVTLGLPGGASLT